MTYYSLLHFHKIPGPGNVEEEDDQWRWPNVILSPKVKKLIEAEERGKLLEKLISKNIGLNEEEKFISREVVKFHDKGGNSNLSSNKEEI